MRYQHVAALCITMLALSGCGGGGSNPPVNHGPTQATQSASIAPAGGSVSVTLGAQTVTITVPSGALSAAGTVSVTLYSNGTAPKTLQSAARRTLSIGAGATLVAEFTVTLTNATLLKPLAASLTTSAASSGSIFRLAGFGTSFDDVDTVTWASGTASTDQNIAYPRMSLANDTVYAFYTEPQSSAGAVPTPVIAVATTATNPLAMLSTATYTATETSPNGFPYLDPSFAFSLDNGSLGTIAAGTGVLTTGPVDGSGHVIATDPTAGRGNPKGSLAVTVSSQRPGNAKDAFTYSGTLSSTTQLLENVTTQPQTSAGTVALTSTVTGFVPATGGGKNTVNSVEVDTYPLQTITTKTLSEYQYVTVASKAILSILGSAAKDSNGSAFDNQYVAGNGILDVLPETSGAFGPNTAALTYTETDPAGYGRERLIAPDGSYSEVGHDPLGDVQTIKGNQDFSATYDATQYSGFSFVLSKPTGTPPTITVSVKQGTTSRGSLTVASWIPTSLAHPSIETDTDSGTTAYPAACSVPAKYGTSGNKIVQTIERVDAALGNLENETTTTYTAPSVGPVCIQLADTVQTFYDYTLQNGGLLLVGALGHPVERTTAAETLTLQSATTSSGAVTSSVKRGAASIAPASIPPAAFAPAAFARAHFEELVRQSLGGMRTSTFSTTFMSKGVKSL